MNEPGSGELWDVVIVGGGPAGLSAALGLGRCMRTVQVCDAGKPRNAPARMFNGYLSRDASTPGEFLEAARAQLVRYDTVRLRRARVIRAGRGVNRFQVALDSGEIFHSRMLLLATGIEDVLPALEGFERFYGATAHSCPLCDAWEHRNEPMVVAGSSQASAELAIELLLWSRDVVLCANGYPAWDERTARQLERAAVRIVETPIARLEGAGDRLEGVRFVDGSFLSRSVLFFSPEQHQRSPLAGDLGCQIAEDGSIQCDERAATCVPGLYAAGNASRGVQMVIAAAAEGMVAALAMNNDLLEADAERGDL